MPFSAIYIAPWNQHAFRALWANLYVFDRLGELFFFLAPN